MGRRSTPQECSRPQHMLATLSLASPMASLLMVRFKHIRKLLHVALNKACVILETVFIHFFFLEITPYSYQTTFPQFLQQCTAAEMLSCCLVPVYSQSVQCGRISLWSCSHRLAIYIWNRNQFPLALQKKAKSKCLYLSKVFWALWPRKILQYVEEFTLFICWSLATYCCTETTLFSQVSGYCDFQTQAKCFTCASFPLRPKW